MNGSGDAAPIEEQIRADEELARRLSSCSGSSIDYARQLSTPQRSTPASPAPYTAPAVPQPPHGGGSMVLVAGVINGFGCEVLIDTGAQSSVVSVPLMQRLNLTSRLDTSMQGYATGVGAAKIIGRCRDVGLELGHVEFMCDFTVIEVNADLLMLGLDTLRYFKCIVDLERGVLVFGGHGGVEIAFLPPERAREWTQFARGQPMDGCVVQ